MKLIGYKKIVLVTALIFGGCASEQTHPIDMSDETIDSLQAHFEKIKSMGPEPDTTIYRNSQTTNVVTRLIEKSVNNPNIQEILLKDSLESCFKTVLAAEMNRIDEDACLDNSKNDIENLAPINEFFKIPVCECKAWGDCTNKQCSCQKLCPANLDVISARAKNLSQNENNLSFTLSDSVFDDAGVESTGGYCWGHATVTQRFQRLAEFDPITTPPFPENDSRWILFYQKLINDIVVHQKFTTIPGFKNLYELSSHPEIKKYLAARVAAQWNTEALSPEGVRSILPQGYYSTDTVFEKLNEIQISISLGLNPALLLIPETESDAHVALAQSIVQESDGSTKVCLIDSNISPHKHQRCLSYLKIQKDGTVMFHYLSDVTSLKKFFTTESDQRSLCLHLIENYQACRKKYQCDP